MLENGCAQKKYMGIFVHKELILLWFVPRSVHKILRACLGHVPFDQFLSILVDERTNIIL